MEYNTQQSKLINGEFGRHIQKMIEYAINIKSRDLRNEQAKVIVKTMAFMTQGPKDSEDFWHKLWDLLFVISDFRLDIDSPYPKPSRPVAEEKPQHIGYQKHNIKFRPYGNLMENAIHSVAEAEDCPEKTEVVKDIARHLKRQYLIWNRDSVNDELIREHLAVLSDNRLQLSPDFVFPSSKKILTEVNAKVQVNTNNGKKKKKKKKEAANNQQDKQKQEKQEKQQNKPQKQEDKQQTEQQDKQEQTK